jgi:hypothetical protein
LPPSLVLLAPFLLALVPAFLLALAAALAPESARQAAKAVLWMAASLAVYSAWPSRAFASQAGDEEADEEPYEVKLLTFFAELKGQVATAVLTIVFRNATRSNIEIDCLVPLPEGAYVSSAVIAEEGLEFTGKVRDRDEAFRVYVEAASEAGNTALIEYAGQDACRARLCPVPPRKERTLKLSMWFLVPKVGGVCTLFVPFTGPDSDGFSVGRQEIDVRLKDTPGISDVYSPLEGVTIERTGNDAAARFQAEGEAAAESFRLFYRTGTEGLGASVISSRPSPGKDGYFLFLAEPCLDAGGGWISQGRVLRPGRLGFHGRREVSAGFGRLDILFNPPVPGRSFRSRPFQRRDRSMEGEARACDR